MVAKVMIPRWRPLRGQPFPDGPFVADVRTFDIPETIAACIRNAATNCVAVTLRPYGGARMIASAERTARKRGIRILWVPTRSALRGGVS